MEPKNMKDIDFLSSIITTICDFAVQNGLEPGETLKTVANMILTKMSVVESLTTPDLIVTTVRESSRYAKAKADGTELEKCSTFEQTSDTIRLRIC